MRTVGLLFMAMAFALAGCMAALADENSCGQQSQPAGVGAGPAPQLRDLTGPAFDEAYMRTMYQQHTDITALTTQGITRCTDSWLRNFSGKIRYEQTKMGEKIAIWYPKFTEGLNLTVNYERSQQIVNSLSDMSGPNFDPAYARTLTALLQQSREASDLAMARATRPELQSQARIVSRSAQREVAALEKWLRSGSLGNRQERWYCQNNATVVACW